MKIVAVMCTYNAADVVERALKSIDGFVDRIIILDNKWKGYVDDNKTTYSNDGTLKIISKFAETAKSKVFMIVGMESMYQHEARTHLFSLVHKGDWILVVDSDEYLAQWDNIREVLETTKQRAFRVLGYGEKPLPQVRLIKKTAGLKYTTDHRDVEDNKGVVCIRELPVVALWLDRQPECKTKKERSRMNEYEKWLYEWEQSKIQ